MRKAPARKKAQPKRVAKAAAPPSPPRPLAVKTPPKRVVITVLRNDKGECIVEPREAYVRPSGTVTFRSKVGPLVVFVPTPRRAANLFPRARGTMFGVPGRGKKLIVAAAKPKRAVYYSYVVFCPKYNEFAKASFPRIIVI